MQCDRRPAARRRLPATRRPSDGRRSRLARPGSASTRGGLPRSASSYPACDSVMSGSLDSARLARLLDAGRALVAELDPLAVLDGILATAREVTGARYAALGILDDQRTALCQFITLGVDDQTRAAIGDL